MSCSHTRYIILLVLAISAISAMSVNATSVEDVNDEINDSQAMKGVQTGQFVAVPIPISNPTVGTGLQAALLYLHPKKNDSPDAPNATSGLGAMYTDNDTWFSGIFHDDYLLQDKLRLRLAAGTGKVVLDFYGSNTDEQFEDDKIGYSLSPNMGMVQVQGRLLAESAWFAGLRVFYSQTDVVFDLDAFISGIPLIEDRVTLVDLALVLDYDSRDNNYYPANGSYFQSSFSREDEAWGSDYNYNRIKLDYRYYQSQSQRNVYGVRFMVHTVSGEAPFFALPSLKLRGFSSTKYQDDAATSAHFEWRHKFQPRWGFIAGFESGAVADTVSNTFDQTWINSAALGVRWQVDSKKKFNLGIDYGGNGDDQALYVQVGETF